MVVPPIRRRRSWRRRTKALHHKAPPLLIPIFLILELPLVAAQAIHHVINTSYLQFKRKKALAELYNDPRRIPLSKEEEMYLCDIFGCQNMHVYKNDVNVCCQICHRSRGYLECIFVRLGGVLRNRKKALGITGVWKIRNPHTFMKVFTTHTCLKCFKNYLSINDDMAKKIVLKVGNHLKDDKEISPHIVKDILTIDKER